MRRHTGLRGKDSCKIIGTETRVPCHVLESQGFGEMLTDKGKRGFYGLGAGDASAALAVIKKQ